MSRADVIAGVLAELVALKDGPRDADYERRKPLAWEKARTVLAAEPAAEQAHAAAPTDAEAAFLSALVVRDCQHEGRTGRDWCCAACHDLSRRLLALTPADHDRRTP